IKQTPLPYQDDQRRVVVKARLNGLVDGTFVVDTGATSVCISEDLARRLHLELGPTEIPVMLADGSTRKARPVLLHSVEVGGVRVERVAALVLPQNPGGGLDGLLGMSFLMEFNVRLDPASHTLLLNRFAPP
ncbi:MAG: retropepsin-like aspartic protease, partial [Kiritimatiellaeota bacterium]|nr:retropepsin-like aspartic protease [Kiritimatiellota bacterium]